MAIGGEFLNDDRRGARPQFMDADLFYLADDWLRNIGRGVRSRVGRRGVRSLASHIKS